ncbi:hypothetical protein GF337_06570 [candidate division KSB1 bacterium]|nr:hypothetical protein [candidate division KSB1 bacterium]
MTIFKKILLIGCVLFLGSIVLMSANLRAQDSTKVKTDTSGAIKKPAKKDVQEIELMEITIEAEIEKPRVSILPKRIEPELGEMEFIDRSFEKELKKGPDKPVLLKERVKTEVNVNELKTTIKKQDQEKDN